MSKQFEEYITLATGVTLHVKFKTPTLAVSLPTLILLHFWGGSSATWGEVVTSLDDRISLIIPSLRGWGKSSKNNAAESYKMVDYANDIVALVSELSIRQPSLTKHGVFVAGHSLGGKIAMQLACNIAVDKLLLGLVLIAPSPASGFDFSKIMLDRMRKAFTSYESASEVARTAMLGANAAGNADLVDRIAKDALQGAREAAVAFPDYGAQENFEALLVDTVESRTHQGRRLEVLVLEGDEKLEGADKRVAAVLSTAGALVQYRSLECGHLIPLEAPLQLTEIIQDFVFNSKAVRGGLDGPK